MGVVPCSQGCVWCCWEWLLLCGKLNHEWKETMYFFVSLWQKTAFHSWVWMHQRSINKTAYQRRGHPDMLTGGVLSTTIMVTTWPQFNCIQPQQNTPKHQTNTNQTYKLSSSNAERRNQPLLFLLLIKYSCSCFFFSRFFARKLKQPNIVTVNLVSKATIPLEYLFNHWNQVSISFEYPSQHQSVSPIKKYQQLRFQEIIKDWTFWLGSPSPAPPLKFADVLSSIWQVSPLSAMPLCLQGDDTSKTQIRSWQRGQPNQQPNQCMRRQFQIRSCLQSPLLLASAKVPQDLFQQILYLSVQCCALNSLSVSFPHPFALSSCSDDSHCASMWLSKQRA